MLFVDSNLTLAQIAEQEEPSIATLRDWSRVQQWGKQRKELAAQLRVGSQQQILELSEQYGPAMLRRHLAIHRQIDNKLRAKLGKEEDLSTEDLLKIARAYKALADVRTKILDPVKRSVPIAPPVTPGKRLSVTTGFSPVDGADPNAPPMKLLPAIDIEPGEPDYSNDPSDKPEPATEWTPPDPNCPF